MAESIVSINRQLKDLYGSDTVTGKAIFRIVETHTQVEKRLSDHTPSGIQLLYPIIQELPKYGPWMKGKYVLERLVVVPEQQQEEIGAKISYEPLWDFRGKDDKPVTPTLFACQFLVNTLYAALGKSSLAKYKNEGNTPEATAKRVAALEEELFGDESSLMGRTITGEAIAMPQNYKSQQENS